MSAMVEDVRINVFGNGSYLNDDVLTSPCGVTIPSRLLDINQVYNLELWCALLVFLENNKIS
jgi:hypothetical protein